LRGEEVSHATLRGLPQVQRLLETQRAAALIAQFGRTAVTEALRSTLDHARVQARAGGLVPGAEQLLQTATTMLAARTRPGLRRTINATGVVLHTNLGRAPLAEAAVQAACEVAASYSNLEYDLDTGRRGARTAAVETLLCELTGAEAALAVNNGAAAILLALGSVAAGGEVIVSRGELVEIGGGFRIPDVIRQGGASLAEVGTTNKTRLADYQAAITGATRALLKVHQSNFRTVGFTAEVTIAELAPLARQHGLPLVADLGSGNLHDLPGLHEPTVPHALAEGADLVTFSGDKLLGGPQAGVIAGRKERLDAIRSHPLLRALRLDKMSLAALEATLRLHRDDPQRIPVLHMLAQTDAELESRAAALLAALGLGATIRTEGFAGGGALPEERIASWAVALAVPGLSADELARRLRVGEPAIVGRIVDGHLALDMLTVSDADIPTIAAAVAALR